MSEQDDFGNELPHEDRRYPRAITDADAEIIAKKLREALRQEAVNVVGSGVIRWVFDKAIIGILIWIYLHYAASGGGK